MVEIEFGTWTPENPSHKSQGKRRPPSPITVSHETAKPVISNACILEAHNLCSGIAYNIAIKQNVECQCDCGICAEFRKDMQVEELTALDIAWKNYCLSLSKPPTDEQREAFNNAWNAAREWYNG